MLLKYKRNYAFVFALLAIAELTSGFKMGSRGLSENMDSRSISEIDAGNKHKNKDTIVKPSNSHILKAFTNKEFVFGDDDNSYSKESEELLKETDSESDEKQTKIKHLNRQQRTNAKNMDLDELEELVLDLYNVNQLELNKHQNKHQNKPKLFNDAYDMFLDDLNSEDIMNAEEIKGSNNNFNIPDYFNNEALASLLQAEMNENDSNEQKPVRKPIIHYKEMFLSGDVYNKKLDEIISKKPNSAYKSITEQPIEPNYPGHMKNGKFSYDDQHTEKINLMKTQRDYLFVSVIAGCTIAALLAFIAGGVCYYTVNRSRQPGFESKLGLFGGSGVTKSNSVKSTTSSSSGDRRLAQSAQMFHYQHQKQQMIAMEKANNDTKQDPSDNSDGETEEGDYTVYECPGLAPTGEMEVKNPLFKEDFPSSNNLTASNSVTSMPPPYSSVTTKSSEAEANNTPSSAENTSNHIEINKNATESVSMPTVSEKEKQ